jgi:hypothetical protein
MGLRRMLNELKNFVLAGALAILPLIGAASQTSASVIDVGNNNGLGDCTFACTLRYQELYSSSIFSGPVDITAVSFFHLSGDSGSWNGTWQMSLSTSPNPIGGLSSSFGANVGADNTVFATETFSGAPSLLTFTGSFNYNPGTGPLLVDIQYVSGSGSGALEAGLNPGLTDRVFSFGSLTTGTLNSDPSTPGNDGYADRTQFEVGATTPLPAALPLFATGLGALGLLGWRRKRKAAALAAA